ncbi:RuBisCO large subunit C-terminal-like domain-containing protein [Dehalococcoidia bacterium]|nr:RuBisCO large subunit C-terminal-like domain-containing protein [Dehalococcoidia bacterium]
MEEYFRVTYQLRVPSVGSPEFKYDFETIAGFMAREGSYGTWVEPGEATNINVDHIRSEYGAYVEYADPETRTVAIRFPAANIDFDYGHVTLLLNTVAGDILGLSGIKQAKVIHIDYPSSWLAKFRGPVCGVQGVRELLGVHDRPLVAFSIKPRLGMEPHETADAAVQAVRGGVDIVEDDERLLNPAYCPIEERVKAVKEALAKVESHAGKKIYSVNVSCRPDRMIELVERVLGAGADALKIDVLATGFPALAGVADHVRTKKPPVPIFVYPALYTIYESAIRREVLLELSRFVGADIVYAGAPKLVGRMDVVDSILRLRHYHEILLRPIEHATQIKRTMPSVSTQVHPGIINYLFKAIGRTQFAYFIGGGIAGNPLGVERGAEFVMRAVQAAVNNPSFGPADFDRLYNREEKEAMMRVGWDYMDWNAKAREVPAMRFVLRENVSQW